MKEPRSLSEQLNDALVALFGAEAHDIHVPHLDHLCTTLTPARVEKLLRAVGGPWVELLHRINATRAAIGTKEPGEDPRHKSDAKATE